MELLRERSSGARPFFVASDPVIYNSRRLTLTTVKLDRTVFAAVPGTQIPETCEHFCSLEECSLIDGSVLLFRGNDQLNLKGLFYLVEKLVPEQQNFRNSYNEQSQGKNPNNSSRTISTEIVPLAT